MARILIAEDDACMLRILSIWLKRNGHEVFEARDGLMAKDALRAQTFDFMVSDINMPGLDGISLVRWLRQAETNSGVLVVLLSSRCDRGVIAEQVAALNVQVHPKPFSPSRLAAEIERRLAEEAMRQETMGRWDGGTKGTDACVGGEAEVVEGSRHG